MRCKNCGAALVPGKQFCPACGTRAPRACPSCNELVDPSFRFCPSCGQQLAAEPAAPPPRAETAPRRSPEVPEALARRILASKDAIEGERKLVTVLFCDLVGSTAIAERLDPEEYHDLLEEYLALAFADIYRFDGIVNQLAGDGLMALFGAPIAHEDAPERAVRAALAIRDALDRFNARGARDLELAVRIGIHTGPVVVGTVGNDLKMDYTAIGDTTNLASRLESLAQPGTILVSEATERLVRGRFDLRAVGPTTVKGKSEPVTAYEVLGSRELATPMAIAAEHGLTPLVGRAPELAQLSACFRQLSGDLAQVLAIVGEAGSGKSRLLYEFKRSLEGTPVSFFEARCAALNQAVPYAPWTAMLRQYFQIAPGESPAAMSEKVAGRVGEWEKRLDDAFPFLCAMLSLPAPGIERLSTDELKRKEFEAMGKLIKAESGRAPVLIIIEDLHWMDEPSREMLDRAVAHINRAPVMLILTHRPEYQPSWQPSAAFTYLRLRRLLDDETREIVRAVVGGPLPPELEQLVLAKAEGSPFFAEELTRALLEGGYLQRDNGHHRLTRPVEEVLLPGTVQEVIAARLDRLGHAAKRVLQVAAVLGRQFGREQLEHLLQGDGIEVGGALDELERRGIIHRKNMFSGDEFRFGESLTQEVAYAGLLLKQRRQLHERIGLLLESTACEASPERWTLLAHHFARSDNRQKAVEALVAAARHAERAPSYRSAARAYRDAWDLAVAETRPGALTPLHHLALEAAIGVGRMTVIYGTPDPGDVHHVLGRAAEIADALGEIRLRSEVLALKGLLMIRHRKLFKRGIALVEEALALAQRAGQATPAMLRPLAWAYFLDGRFAVALQLVERATEEIARAGHVLTDIGLGTRFMRDRIEAWCDDPVRAQEHALATFALATQASNRTVQCSIASTLAQLHFIRGEYAEALQWAERGLEVAGTLGFADELRVEAAIILAARLELGEPLPAARAQELMERYLHPESERNLNVHVIVDVLLQLGEVERAERIAQTAVDRASGCLPEMVSALALSDVQLQLGPEYWGEAARGYAQALERAEASGARAVEAAVRLGVGRLAAVRGDVAAARHTLEHVLALCAPLQLQRYAARAGRVLADLPDLSAAAIARPA
jgi:class 3 adenylate cyclase/RNA polymerase subunit RPABC4/transcription elongation factor Spt4